MRFPKFVRGTCLIAAALSLLAVSRPAIAEEAISIVRGDGDDIITIEPGNYLIDGGNGNDTLVLPYFPNAYRVTATDGEQVTVEYFNFSLNLKNIEYLQFGKASQTTITLDSLLQGKAQQDLGRLTDFYLSFLDRAPEPEGLEYWQERLLEEGQSFGDIAKDFALSEEVRLKPPTGTSDREFIRLTYQQFFHREPDPEGWDYWTNRLQTAGGDPNQRGAFLGELLLGAYAPTSGERDRNYLTNRHELSLSYANWLAERPGRAYESAFLELLDLVNDDPNTLRDAQNVLERRRNYSWNSLEYIMSHKELLETLWTNDPNLISDKVFGFADPQLQYCVNVIRRVTFQRLSEITELPCAAKGIASLEGIQNLTGLQVLELADTKISDLSPLRDLTALTTLSIHGPSLRGPRITDLAPLENLTRLTSLSLDVYNVSDITPIRNLTNLRTLSLTRGRVSDISPLRNLTNLTSLELPGPVFADVDFDLFAPGINLDPSPIDSSPSSLPLSDIAPLAYLTNLELLNIGGYRINDISPLLSLVNLKNIAISNNQIEDITPLAGLVNLTSLDLGHNRIKDVTPLQELTGLTELTLTNNLIGDISTLRALTALESLQLGANRLSDISPLQNLFGIVELGLSNNRVSDLSPLSNQAVLRQLELNNNLVSDISPLQGLESLEELILSRNHLDDISALENLHGLKVLSLSHNLLSDISALQSLDGLSKLSLIDNFVCDFSPLDHLPKVDMLFISGNECIDAGGTLPDCEPESPEQAKIYFEYSYSNYAWVAIDVGFYINSLGEVYSYDHSGHFGQFPGSSCLEKGSIPYCPEFTISGYCPRLDDNNPVCQYSEDPNSEENLLARLSTNQTYLGRIDPAVVEEMYAKVAWAASAALGLPYGTADDSGSSVYKAYVYDCARHAYRPVLLRESGDVTITNSAPEATELVEWLRQVTNGL